MSSDRGILYMLPYSKYQIPEGVDAPARLGEIVMLLENFERPSYDWLRVQLM